MALNLNDWSPSGNNLTNNNTVTEVTTSLPFVQSTSAAQFVSTSSQSLSIADASQTGLDLSSTMTLELWAKLSSAPGTNATYVLINKHDNGANQQGYFIQYEDRSGVKKIEVLISQDATGTVRDAYSWNVDLGTSTWHHIALTVNAANLSATTFELFIDGVSQGNGTAIVSDNASSINNNTSAFYIGCGVSSGTPFNFADVIIDEVRVWNTVRTSTQISNNKSNELVGNESGLVAYYPFESLSSLSPSASRSPSASVSPSSSASNSLSPSSSISLSLSPSASQSPSASFSPSSSTSPSTSPSTSASASFSPSTSLSPSPSSGYELYTRGDYASLPLDTTDLKIIYTDSEEVNVANQDNVVVGQTGTQMYMLHQFKNFIGGQTMCEVQCISKSSLAPTLSPVYLQVYNQSTHLWETTDSDRDAGEDIYFELKFKLANLTNYLDTSKVMTCRIYQLAI